MQVEDGLLLEEFAAVAQILVPFVVAAVGFFITRKLERTRQRDTDLSRHRDFWVKHLIEKVLEFNTQSQTVVFMVVELSNIPTPAQNDVDELSHPIKRMSSVFYELEIRSSVLRDPEAIMEPARTIFNRTNSLLSNHAGDLDSIKRAQKQLAIAAFNIQVENIAPGSTRQP